VTDDSIELFGPHMLADPHRAYGRLRDLDPVSWNPSLSSWVLTRFSDVRDVLHDPSFSSTLPEPAGGPAPSSGQPPAEVLSRTYSFVRNSLVFSDPPAHVRLRRLVSRAFAPGVVEALSDIIASITDRLLDKDTAELDLVAELAEPLPMAVLGQLLGVALSQAEGRRVKAACDDFLLPFGRDPATLAPAEIERARAAGNELNDFVTTVLARSDNGERQADGVVHRLIAGEADDQLSREELFANIVLLLVAGHENLTSLLGNGAALLLDLPDVRSEVDADPARWPSVVDELLRLVTPNQFIRRRALVDVAIAGRTIRAGETVLLVLASANRDPARFPDPDRFVLDRPDRRDLAMGLGPHYCLGAPLARLEARIALQTLFARYPRVRRATDVLEYVPNFNVRLLRALPIVLR
jgi:cytochrome P450